MDSNTFTTLSDVDCSAHTEKKGKFTYLSWPFAFAELFKRYPKAEISVREWDGFPATRSPAKGWMVHVTVTIDGASRSQWHPVLDNNNRTIVDPDVFAINTSIQRATVKAIALHGLGLYIYAGEDLPESAKEDADAKAKKWVEDIKNCKTQESVNVMKSSIRAEYGTAENVPDCIKAACLAQLNQLQKVAA